MKVSTVVLFLSLIVCFGCKPDLTPGTDWKNARAVSFEQFKQVTNGETFMWVGSDDNYHYFKTNKGYYSLPASFKMPTLQRIIDRKQEPGALGVNVTILNGESIGAPPNGLQSK